MKILRKTSLIALSLLILSTSFIFSGCESSTTVETTTSEAIEPPLLTDGVFDGSFAAEGFGITMNYIKFYPEDVNSGKSIFYYSVSGDQDRIAGYYTVEEVEFTYSTWYNRDDRLSIAAESLMITGTAKYTITLYDFFANELTQFGYDTVNNSGIIYGFYLEGYPDFVQNVCYYQKTENLGEYSESPVAVYEFMVAGDYTTKLSIWHDGTYTYKTATENIQGTWVTTTTANVYTLYETETEILGTLGVSTSGDIGTLLPTAGSKLNLVEYVAEVLFTYQGSDTNHVFTDAMTLSMSLYIYADYTVEVEVEYGGVALTGTWELDENENYSFILEGDDLIVNSSSCNGDSSVITINVTNSYNDVTGDLVLTVEE